MKNALVLILAVLGAAANIAWAGSQPFSPSSSSPAPSHPPLQCACVVGSPAA